MISVMNEREIDRDSSSAAAAANISFFAVENPQEEPRDREVMIDLDPDEEKPKIDPSLSPESDNEVVEIEMDKSGVLESKPDVGFEVSRVSHEGSFSDGSLSYYDSRVSYDPEGAWMHGFRIGDMVWGKVKSHPWWPGHIFNEAFASSSVRRTKREGHVLVAFFGDSSYGWFDPAELIPFGPNFLEKSKQTASRNFLKAVEEAADEAGRRGALSVACCCRKPSNFHPAGVAGYFFVDVAGFEPAGIYSDKQIKSARDKFEPKEVVSFVHSLALAPRSSEDRDIDFFRSKAMMLAYRKAVYEEFDETYAQAFGMAPVRPSPNEKATMDQLFAQQRAIPFSGQLVIAEALGVRKSVVIRPTTKFAKLPSSSSPSASSSKKNKYVLKRREEPGRPTAAAEPISYNGHPRPSLPDLHPSPMGAAPAPTLYYPAPSQSIFFGDAGNDYVLQKRAPMAPTAPTAMPQQQFVEESKAVGVGGAMVVSEQRATDRAFQLPAYPSVFDDWKPSRVVEAGMDSKDSVGVGLPMPARDRNVVDGVVKKPKIPKRQREDGSETGDVVKKKKKKKLLDPMSTKNQLVVSKIEERRKRLAAKYESLKREGEAATVSSAAQLPKLDLSSLNVELPQVLTDLQELALDPFHGNDRNAPLIVRNVLLKFRSLVYQKSLVLPPASEPDTAEPRPSKLLAGRPRQEPVAGITEVASGKIVRDQREHPAAIKPLKPKLKPEDPTKGGRKRGPSDRQEEMIAKKVKTMNKLKALSSEKKAGVSQKVPEGEQRDQKDTASTTMEASTQASAQAPAATKPNNKVESVKKHEPPPPPKTPCPTALVMKFPPRTTLPSVASLKARFARFGQLDLSGTRVYWKSHTCKVIFKFKSDAQIALSYVRNNDLFGQIKVQYHLREIDETGSEVPSDPVQQRLESRVADAPSFRPGSGSSAGVGISVGQSRPTSYQQQQRPPLTQPKSILKKPVDDVGTTSSNAAKEAPRVKFLLGSSDESKAEAPLATAGNGNGSNGADGRSSMDPLISKNTRSVSFGPPPVPPLSRPTPSQPSRVFDPQHIPLPPPLDRPMLQPRFGDGLLPTPPPRVGDRSEVRRPAASQFSQRQMQQNDQFGDLEGSYKPKVDISKQMMSLLMRCSDIVTSVKNSLGYVPYHPL
ncbi:PWWP domain-containing protein 1-like [Typha angustifolia]|uniref:PWWP domain-containing protein 1-like n=1 Tax=Typha angustifolia TaxID=59011 RepID=UPI003C2C36D3